MRLTAARTAATPRAPSAWARAARRVGMVRRLPTSAGTCRAGRWHPRGGPRGRARPRRGAVASARAPSSASSAASVCPTRTWCTAEGARPAGCASTPAARRPAVFRAGRLRRTRPPSSRRRRNARARRPARMPSTVTRSTPARACGHRRAGWIRPWWRASRVLQPEALRSGWVLRTGRGRYVGRLRRPVGRSRRSRPAGPSHRRAPTAWGPPCRGVHFSTARIEGQICSECKTRICLHHATTPHAPLSDHLAVLIGQISRAIARDPIYPLRRGRSSRPRPGQPAVEPTSSSPRPRRPDAEPTRRRLTQPTARTPTPFDGRAHWVASPSTAAPCCTRAQTPGRPRHPRRSSTGTRPTAPTSPDSSTRLSASLGSGPPPPKGPRPPPLPRRPRAPGTALPPEPGGQAVRRGRHVGLLGQRHDRRAGHAADRRRARRASTTTRGSPPPRCSSAPSPCRSSAR